MKEYYEAGNNLSDLSDATEKIDITISEVVEGVGSGMTPITVLVRYEKNAVFSNRPVIAYEVEPADPPTEP